MIWTNDIGAETVLKSLSIKYEMKSIDACTIDVKLSRANTARAFRIDFEHAESISLGIMRDDPIPAIVVRKCQRAGTHRYVIAGGNHRDEGCRIAGESKREAYVVECTDTEFTILCRLLNTWNSKAAEVAVIALARTASHACLVVASTKYTDLEIISDVKEISLRCKNLAQRLSTLS